MSHKRDRVGRISQTAFPSALGYLSKDYHYGFRYQHAQPHSQIQQDLHIAYADLERWINEFLNDIHINPTAYLFITILLFLVYRQVLLQFYAVIWQLSDFLFGFVPWDDEAGLGYY